MFSATDFFFHSRVLSCVLQQHMWVTLGSGQWNCCPHSSVRLFIVASAECTRSVMRVLASDGIWKWPWSSQIKLVHSDVEIDSSNIPNYSESFALLYLLKSLFIQIKSIPYPGLWWQLRFFFFLVWFELPQVYTQKEFIPFKRLPQAYNKFTWLVPSL